MDKRIGQAVQQDSAWCVACDLGHLRTRAGAFCEGSQIDLGRSEGSSLGPQDKPGWCLILKHLGVVVEDERSNTDLMVKASSHR